MCGRYVLTYEELVELEEFLDAIDAGKYSFGEGEEMGVLITASDSEGITSVSGGGSGGGASVSVGISGSENFNVAPTNLMPLAYLNKEGVRILEKMHWGYMGWVPDGPQKTFLPINARDDSLLQKPMWKKAFQLRRCIVPMNGFYEWSGEKGKKTPHYIQSNQRKFLAAAGVYSDLSPQEGVKSYAIITTSPNALMEDIHDRMPAFLEPEEFEKWLDPDTPIEFLVDMLQPYPDDALKEHKVSKDVGSTRNNHAGLIEPEKKKPSKDDQTSMF